MLPGNTPVLFRKAGDPFTKLLVHADGTDNQTIVADSSPANHGNATLAGSAAIWTTQKKFGTASLYFPIGGYATWPNSADWDFGAGDFTIDWWVYALNWPTGGGFMARDGADASWSGGWILGYITPGYQGVYMTSNKSAWDIANNVKLGEAYANQWHHYAITRSGTTFRTFQDGVKVSEWTNSLALPASSGALSIGRMQNIANWSSYVDELRVSKGIARWTANFTPPTAPYS